MEPATKSKRPAGLEWRSHTLFILSTVAIGLFTDLFLYGLIIPILPFLLEDEAGIPAVQIQSYTSAMLAAYAASTVLFSPMAGVVADKASSQQSSFLFGLICLLGATVLFFVSKTIAMLMLARVLQGISCAFVWTIGLSICFDTVGPGKMGQTIGTIFSIIAVGTLFAPFIGGRLYERAGMRGVMALAISLLGIDLVMRLLIIEKKTTYALGGGATDGDGLPRGEWNNSSASHILSHEAQPLLDDGKATDREFVLAAEQHRIVRAVPILACLSNASLLTALWGSMAQAILMGSFDATVALVSCQLFGFNASQAGMLFLPIGIMHLVCGPIVGWVVDRYGTKIAAVFAFGTMVPVLVLLRFVHVGGAQQVAVYAVLLCFAGIGLAGSGTPSIVEAGTVIDHYHKANPNFFGEKGPYAMVYGINGMVFNAGLTIGPALAGGLKETVGYGNMNAVMAAISGVTALLCYLYMGNKPKSDVQGPRKSQD